MKILKILLILLVPGVGIVGCEKSGMKPGCGNGQHEEKTEVNSNSNQVGSRPVFSEEENINGSDVVGSGDDDRDGGDKKTKKIR